MDSGLGSDEERRSRTKEQKQRHNQQLLSGCFIDAATLSDDTEVSPDQRRNHERRQGALLFQSSIPQFSMLQMPAQHLSVSCTSIPTATSYSTDNTTPYNSIVHLDHENGSQKPSLGFYVDLSEVGEPETEENEEQTASTTSTTTTKKNIFSMVIDFEAPKKDKPICLSSSLRNGKKLKNGDATTSATNGKGKCNLNSEQCIKENGGIHGTIIESQCSTQYDDSPILYDEARSQSMDPIKDCEDDSVGVINIDKNNSDCVNGDELTNHGLNVKMENIKQDEDDDDNESNIIMEKKFVKLSDLEHQTPRTEILLVPRMSRSIPESSWVESPLFMSNSIGYRSAPRPLDPDNNGDSDGGSSNTDTSISQPKRSVARLGTDLLRMFLEEIGPDVIVEVGTRKIRAHRCILVSRCQYFAASLSGRTRDIITITGFSYDAVHFAMCHIYSGAAHVPDSIGLAELASLADMLCLEGLKEVVAHALKSRHCHNFHRPCAGCCIGVVEVLHLSAAYGLDELYQKCLRWITQHFAKVWPTKAFCGLTKELREKCYQQHIIHFSSDNVLETMLGCNRLLLTVPAMRWAETVNQMGMQLNEACQLYLRQNFVDVLSSTFFLALDDEHAWNISRLDEPILYASSHLSIDQACKTYTYCDEALDKTWSPGFGDLLKKIYQNVEQSLVSKADRVSKSNSWPKLNQKLKLKIKEISCLPLDDCPKPRPTRMPISKNNVSPRLRTTSNRNTPSSTESSRNTSPSMKTGCVDGSPSLRRSLLLAARAPQVPPSPSVQRRSSTLTKPTASSAAKVAPSKNLKTQPTKIASVNKASGVTKSATTSKVNKDTTSPRVNVPIRNAISRDSSKANVPRCATTNTHRISTPSSSRKFANAKETVKVTASASTSSKRNKPTTIQRSGTFLKEKPTVIGKLQQTDAPLVQT